MKTELEIANERTPLSKIAFNCESTPSNASALNFALSLARRSGLFSAASMLTRLVLIRLTSVSSISKLEDNTSTNSGELVSTPAFLQRSVKNYKPLLCVVAV